MQRRKRLQRLKEATYGGNDVGSLISGTVKGNAGTYQVINQVIKRGASFGSGRGKQPGSNKSTDGGRTRPRAVSTRASAGTTALGSNRLQPSGSSSSAAYLNVPNASTGMSIGRSPVQVLPARSATQRLTGREYLFFPTYNSLAYLDGSLPGDYGFDPLGLYDPAASAGLLDRQWLSYSEVIHGRWAMLGAVGCIAPEILGQGQSGAAGSAGIEWFKTGWFPPAGSYEYGMGVQQLFVVQLALMSIAEMARYLDYRAPGSVGRGLGQLGLPQYEQAFAGSGVPAYPGGPVFNFANFVETDAAIAQFREMEVKHGRLAMIAMFGYGVQAMVTGQGPWRNFQDHLADPLGHNILTSLDRWNLEPVVTDAVVGGANVPADMLPDIIGVPELL
eukprot:jgi/Chrzof1/14138/Cz08g26140.t1_LHC10[v5.2]